MPRVIVAIVVFLFLSLTSYAQVTRWVGSTSTNWKVASNWTNGVPDATKDTFVGDAFFTGTFQPTLPSGTGSGTCKTLTVGGARATTLVVNDDLTVSGDVLFNSNATVSHTAGNFIVRGNWTNNGSYTGSAASIRVYLSGTGGVTQTVGGSTVTTFRRLYVSTGASVLLSNHINVATFINLLGTFDPATFQVQGVGGIDLGNNALLKVNTGTFAGNYANSGTINPTSSTAVIEYGSTTIPQTVSGSFNYRDLRIAGTTVKTLAANVNIISDLFITGGTLDLTTFTANRTAAGGSITMAAGTTLRIGGTGTFPTNYSTRSLAATSTVEYYGGNQVVTPLSYGNLIMACGSSGITKSSTATAFTVAGNLSLTCVAASTMSFVAAQSVTVSGNVSIASGSTFNGNNFSHTIRGNWTNAGSFSAGAACTATFTSAGASSQWTGNGTNAFANLTITGNATVIDAATSITLCGNFATSGGGTLTHNTGGAGTFTMTGAARTISGSNIILDDLIVSAAATVTTTATFVIAGGTTIDGTLTASTGTISLTGTSKTIAGSGALTFSTLNIPGTITTARDFTLTANLSVAGSLTASAGTLTFNGTSTFSGTASLFNMAINASRTLTMGANATLNIAGTETLGGGFVFNVTTNTPNTVVYNSTGAQTIQLATFNNLTVTNGNTKTASGAKTINGNFTIGTSTTFSAGTFTHTVARNWLNQGTFTAGTSTVQFTGTNDATITGATTFSTLTINKGTSNVVTMLNHVNTLNAIITAGTVLTGANTITITGARTGNGFILGTITRTHLFNAGTNYLFEGPNNYINFAIVGTVTSVTVRVTVGLITSFPAALAINRNYNVTVTGVGYDAYMRLHYQQAEVNGNAELALNVWSKPLVTWMNLGFTDRNDVANWVGLGGIVDLSGDWTLSDGGGAFNWLGNTDVWNDPTNWSSGAVPSASDIVRIGNIPFGVNPRVTGSASAKGLNFGSAQPVVLTIAAGSTLDVQGNIDGTWVSNANHSMVLESNADLLSDSDIVLSDGTSNHTINLTIAAGAEVTILGSLTQSGNASINFTGNGELSIGESFTYSSGAFTAGTGTVTYDGTTDQLIAPITYYNLTINKTSGVALTNTSVNVNGSLLLQPSGGQLDVGGTLNVTGDVTISTSSTLNDISSTISVGGNWLTSGTFNPGDGEVQFNGTGAQTVNATTFNNVLVNKASGTLTLNGNLNINGDINVQNGNVDVGLFDVTRTTTGGTATLGAGAYVRFAGAGLQIQNFAALTANAASTVEYYGTLARQIPPITFGNLIVDNGAPNAKTMIGPTVVQGNLTITADAALVAPSTTLQVGGNIIAAGTFDASGGTLVLNGAARTIAETGTITYNNIVVNGSYTVTSGDIIFNGELDIHSGGSLNLGTATVLSHGDLTNAGTLSSAGVVTFSGLQVQTLRLTGTLSASTGTINFNGSVSPVLNSTTSPAFATVNINNTALIQASQGWIVTTAMNIASGSSWDGGALNHTILGNFSNSGTVTSAGTITFSPTTSVNVSLGSAFTSTGKVVFGGTGLTTVSGSSNSFGSIDITNTNGSGVTAPTGWTLAGDMYIGPGATLHGSAFTHTIQGAWNNNGTFVGGSSTVVFTSNTTTDELIGSGNSNFTNLTFAAGSSLTVVAPISIGGNLTNNSTSLLFEFGKVTFTGSFLSIIGGTSVTTFDDFELNKTSANVRLDVNATINDTFILTSGVLDLNARTLTLANPLNSAVVRTGGYVLSENNLMTSRITWSIGPDVTAHEFPFGNSSGVYIPFTFLVTTGDAGNVTLATYGTGTNNSPFPPTVGHIGNALGNNNSANVVDRFFQVNVTGTPVATMTFSVSTAEVGSITTLRAQRWNGSNWDAALAGQSNNVTGTGVAVTVPGVTTFSPWAISGNSVPLPIQLASFNAAQEGNHVAVQWITESELDNDYFEIEKSANGENFSSIGRVKGAGNSSERIVYAFNDNEINVGRTYYRLKQVDFDRTTTYSKVVSVSVESFDPIEFKVYPNPVTESLLISSTSPFRDVLAVSVHDQTGKAVIRSEANEFGQEPVLLDVKALPPGAYIVRIKFSTYQKTFRIVRAEQ